MCLASHFVDKFALPEQHDVLLVFLSLLDFSGEVLARLFLLNAENITECTVTKLFLDFKPAIQNFLTFFQLRHSTQILINIPPTTIIQLGVLGFWGDRKSVV